ncbi:putative ROK family transcriptional regulator [Actinacidiphila reveromycinica]|uniref:Putative ROK family transcriptional regulator n=1 Tax=Actinacidiphila reveromycinica TaxID=659352 RepID=A0A7U3UPG8_9ACTN|nr:ROK family transcriptional regulator [Streptomyces sp. SN-593]BBA96256.1 putative ROK family transcriptional regulator [Streptomyces sp. SN-593]
MTQGGTNLPRVGGYNQAVILDAIRTAGPVSRVELAPLTGLTSQTVSNVVRRLLAAGLITESGYAPSSGGKRRTLLSPRADGAFAVGVQLDPDGAVVVVVDLAGEVLASRRVRLVDPGEPADVVARVAAAARRLTARTRVDPARLLGTGIATPGPIDGTAGDVVLPPNFPGWGRVPLLEMFGAATGMPVAMDNDATAAAIGERWIGGRARAGSFLFLYLGTGIGAGIVLNNTVLHGDSGNAGEFGHMAVEPGDRICHCGGNNCLGPYVSPSAVLSDLLVRHGRGAAERIGLACAEDSVHADWKLLCRAARRGDPAARDVVRAAAARIGQAARGAVALLDVERVVLGGEALRGIEAIMCEEVASAVNTTSVTRAIRPVAVERSVIGDAVGAVGAASLVLHGTYAPGWRMLTQPSPSPSPTPPA